ncbi:galactose-3-O-sulfotransferase 3-like isoform X2 [Saccoglossus kowalevskii]|uniref:Galactose-3-O-sulfotransferase 3-like n=1 Tax=Saccoglossus kowalevskii TaxID=10224 RepID=A0ABM0M2Q3_SACKO|nr:PREDICTED: galactose-3-O-sulfotransferase 3-like [Saccoglossus kowalevskii]
MGKRREFKCFVMGIATASISFFFIFMFTEQYDVHSSKTLPQFGDVTDRTYMNRKPLKTYEMDRSLSHECDKQTNIAFIKPHKTGGTTLASIVNRFGYDRHASFVICKYNRRNGHLRQLAIRSTSPGNILLPPVNRRDGNWRSYRYNMIGVHIRYNRTAMNSFMVPNTRYITILREPVAQFESFFNYMHLNAAVTRAGRPVNTTALEAFMERPDFYLPKLFYDRDKDSRNNQFYYLGFDTKFHEDERMINETIQRLEEEMDMVLITDYFDESLVVMKKLFCWEMEDVLYISKNQRTHRSEVPAELAEKIRAWNRADVLLYDHFNKTLWRRIHEYGPDFKSDLAQFRLHLSETFDECIDSSGLQNPLSRKIVYKAKKHTSKFCKSLTRTHLEMHNKIWKRQSPLR